jgi:hypothetical protein
MPGMNVGPSQGFMARFKQNLPQAVNQLGGMMPGPFGQTARLAGTLMKKPATPKQPSSSAMPSASPVGPQPPVNGPNTMPSSTGMSDTGMVRGPRQITGMPGMGGFSPGMNTGVTGGMLPGMHPGMGMPMQPPMGDVQNPGIFNMYNQMLQQRRPMLG